MRNLCLLGTTILLANTTHAQTRRVITTPQPGAMPSDAGTTSIPVREVTVFKDGHTFVLHEGEMPVTNGEVVLDSLPTPVIGTFWAYSKGGKLNGVVASRRLVSSPKTAQSVRELLKANVGAEVIILEGEKRYEATVLGVPQADKEEIGVLNPELSVIAPPVAREEIILLQTPEGVRVAPLDSIRNVIFKTAPKPQFQSENWRNLLRLQLPTSNQTRANVGMVYLQKGLRWIPSYRISLDGQKRANVKLQATLVNDLIDLKNTTANLVIGVPSFAFKDTPDPISLQNTFAQLSSVFQPGTRGREAFSNSIQSQSFNNSYALAPPDNGDTAATVSGAGASEDFFLFTLQNLNLNKGERMVMPITQYDLAYQDIYTMNTPLSPPSDLYRTLNYQQQNEIALNLARPSVMHKLRLLNNSQQPLTTAPAIIESNGRLLAQTMMTYTATGGRSDLDLAPAVDVTARQSETEMRRTPNALKWRNSDFEAIDVTGKLTVTSYRNAPITLELTRQFIGTVTRVSNGGVIRKLGASDDEIRSASFPSWWTSGDEGWRSVNAISAVTWTVQIPPKKSVDLSYDLNYFWR